VTQNFETEVRRGVVEELSKEYRVKSASGESRNKSSAFSGFDCMSLSSDTDFMNGGGYAQFGSGSPSLRKKSDSCSFSYEDIYEKKRGCLANSNPTSIAGAGGTTLSSSTSACYSTPSSPTPLQKHRRALRSSYSHPHRVRFSQHDTVVLFQPDNEDRLKHNNSASSGDDYRYDTYSMSDDDVVSVHGDEAYNSLVSGELRSSVSSSASSSGEIVRSQSLIIGDEVEPDREQSRQEPAPVSEPEPHYFTLQELTAIAKREGLI